MPQLIESPPDAITRNNPAAEFIDVVEPLVRNARDRVSRGARAIAAEYEATPFDPDKVEEQLFASVPDQLQVMLTRVMVLELNVARMEGNLTGATPGERYRSFLERLRKPAVRRAIFDEYQVLERQLIQRLDQWAEFSLDFLRHLCADWDEIRETLLPGDPGFLVSVNGGAGDLHRRGRCVLIAEFSDGRRLVYKPRSMAVDVHFQELLVFLNEHGLQPEFKTTRVLDRGGYGWVEFIAPSSCDSTEEVTRFYTRQGGYLALLYALEASDFHCENLIAAGEHPMLLDLEALFHPRYAHAGSNLADQAAGDAIGYSVLKVGLLPQRYWASDESAGVDMSGLGSAAGQLTPRGVPRWDGEGTDEMRLTRKRVALPGQHNRPLLNGSEANALDYAEPIAEGFGSVYRFLLKHREQLLAQVARFADDEVRMIARATQTYAVLLYESFHPDVLRKYQDRDVLFDRLEPDETDPPALKRLVSAERIDLWNGDIPFFSTRPSSRDVWTSANERIIGYLDAPGMESAKRRIEGLSDQDLEQQLWIVRASLATLAPPSDDQLPRRSSRCRVADSREKVDQGELVERACAIGDRLQELAIHGDGDVSWLGLSLFKEREWFLAPLSIDLYDGLPGVALFLGYLGATTADQRYTRLAKAALATVRTQVKRSRELRAIGAFQGWGGIIYVLAHLGSLWSDATLLGEANELACLVPAIVEGDTQLDVIGGAAGCILGLSALYSCAPSRETLEAARSCGEHLLETAQSCAQGIGWLPGGFGATPLTGFAHGNAGIARALVEVFGMTGDERFRTAAADAIAYERSLFSRETGNWPDLRFGTSRFAMAWCHGAPGIGLGRLGSLRYMDGAAIRAEIGTSLNTTLAHGFGRDHALCHGDLGNAELLLQAGQILSDAHWLEQANRAAAEIAASIDREGWICSNPMQLESPGLMTGLAGIGYGLLRLAHPERVPSVLALAPPELR